MVELIEVSSCGQGGNSGKETFEVVITIMSCFICILVSSNSSTITFLSSIDCSEMKDNFWLIKQWLEIIFHFRTVYSSRGNWNGISEPIIQMAVELDLSWTDEQSSHFSTAKEMSVKAIFLLM